MRARCALSAARKNEARHIARDVHEDARDVARRKMKTKGFLKSRDQRKRVEMRFAHLKTHHGFERLRLRSLSGARDGSTLRPSCRTSRRWVCTSSGRHPARLRVSCVASVGGVRVEVDAPRGEAEAPADKLFLSLSINQAASLASRGVV
jgi:DDE family transposase